MKFAWVLAVVIATGCGTRGVRPRTAEPWPEKLSSWRLFEGRLAELKPAAGVVPYDINTPLFSDYAHKQRFVWMPAGSTAAYREREPFEFPVGTIISKSFSYSGRLIETRLLIRTATGWTPLVYVWNREQTEARLEVAANPVTVEFNGSKIDYAIPNTNQCKGCHDQDKRTELIGPTARQLNREYDYSGGRENQIAYWSKIGYLTGAPDPRQAPRLPEWNNPATGSIAERARAYIEINCAHCHNPKGAANTTGLYLTASELDATHLGICKPPVAAGAGSGDLLYGVVPGRSAESILVLRMESTAPKVMMPEIGRSVVDHEAVRLVREWIDSMKGRCG